MTATMVSMAFKDSTNTLPSKAKGGWVKVISRLLFHYGVNICFNVAEAASDQVTKDRWSESKFIEAVGAAMKYRRRSEEDESSFIIWRTHKTRGIKYENLKAMIVADNIHQPSSLPTRKRKRTTCFEFGENPVTNVVHQRDSFFMWLKPSSSRVQLNDILFGRMYLSIEHKHPATSGHHNCPPWKEFYRTISTSKGVNLAKLWSSQTSCEKAFQEFLKKVKANRFPRVACAINQSNWSYPSGGGIYPFQYTAEVERDMKDYLSTGNTLRAMEYALQGYITDTFLEWMVSMKDYYTHLQNSGPAQGTAAPGMKKLFLRRAGLE